MEQMNDIEIIGRDLRSRFPGALVTIDAPSDPAGTWYVDVRGKQQALTIQWRRDRGFGVSTVPGAYGEGAQETYSTIAQVEDRVAELLHPTPAVNALARLAVHVHQDVADQRQCEDDDHDDGDHR